MRMCPYCGYSNLPDAPECVKCGTSLMPHAPLVIKKYRVGPDRAYEIRHKALAFFVIGLMIKVYWGGYGSWQPIDNPTLQSIRVWIEPLFIYGGLAAYILGWVLKKV